MSLIDQMLARKGKTAADYDRRSNLGKLFRRKGVRGGKDFERIKALPRRDYMHGVEGLIESVNEWLKTPEGTMTLRPIQVAALQEIHDFGGLLAPIRVGGGKTLISFLAGTVLEAQKTLLLIPASLRAKTERELVLMREHWRIGGVSILSYEMLGRLNGEEILLDFDPDLIIADEAHRLKNPRAACTRRIKRRIEEHGTRFVGMSGTITKRSLREYWHLTCWALKQPPVPRQWKEMSDWADCLDTKVQPEKRMKPGCLLDLCSEEERASITCNEDLEEVLPLVRAAYRRRFVETPGIIATDESYLGSSLRISGEILQHDDETIGAFKHLRTYWETPDGHPFTMATDLWRHARELACGFYYVWNPRPPSAWMDARREWCAFCREFLKSNRRGVDTEAQVALLCQRGELDDLVYNEWRNVRESFAPNTEAVWVSETTLNAAADWLAENSGICWVEHVVFGEELARRTGLHYYAGQGKNEFGESIEDAHGPVIVSIAANSEGRNLQRWSKNLVVSCPPGGSTWEQMIGRTHRDGQEADEVSFDILLSCVEQWAGFWQSMSDARYVEQSTGQAQKLLIADIDMPSEEFILGLGPLWASG